jgi:hypothetical protein
MTPEKQADIYLNAFTEIDKKILALMTSRPKSTDQALWLCKDTFKFVEVVMRAAASELEPRTNPPVDQL